MNIHEGKDLTVFLKHPSKQDNKAPEVGHHGRTSPIAFTHVVVLFVAVKREIEITCA
jgi:hypothetical protein